MNNGWKHLNLLITSLYLILQPLFVSYADTQKSAPPAIVPSENLQRISFAILNHDYVMQESTATQYARNEIDQQRTDFQEEINQHEQNLRERERKLIDSQRTLNEAEYAKKQQEYESDFADIQRKVAERRRQLEESFNKARENIVEAILKIVTDIAQERSLEIVLPRSMIFYAQETYDISDEVLNRLNKMLPKVTLDAFNSQPPLQP